ncbi:hypothetical protein [Nitrosovibrio sp. Nv6]|uniref:hypothetical protein n=1 Tax=Nitrosovibrio sp. Nv6 TaxID=1855340 RepID=UPI0008BACEF2|nr:hypothetical protein [Nitrosovibrio sp. Nv6]SEO63639.1 hypothetical protein SAMN05216316_0674 [Nitrosovibrio sp. Nv6]
MKVPVHNNTGMPIYVGSAMILPGETRHFDKHDVPDNLRPKKVAAAEVDEATPPGNPLVELLQHKVEDVKATLPTLADGELELLGELEQLGGNPRKGVLSAVAEEILKRAEAKGNA